MHLGLQEESKYILKISTQEVDLCDCNQKKLFTIHRCQIKNPSVAVHFCKHLIPKNATDTGQTCIDQCSKYLLTQSEKWFKIFKMV